MKLCYLHNATSLPLFDCCCCFFLYKIIKWLWRSFIWITQYLSYPHSLREMHLSCWVELALSWVSKPRRKLVVVVEFYPGFCPSFIFLRPKFPKHCQGSLSWTLFHFKRRRDTITMNQTIHLMVKNDVANNHRAAIQSHCTVRSNSEVVKSCPNVSGHKNCKSR